MGLEKSLLDLHQIFLDMAVLAEAQGGKPYDISAQTRAANLWQGLTQAHGHCTSCPGSVMVRNSIALRIVQSLSAYMTVVPARGSSRPRAGPQQGALPWQPACRQCPPKP